MNMDGSALPSTDLDAYRGWMSLLKVQHGIVDRVQALQAGFTRRQIEYRLNSATWRSVYPGIYATFSGPLSHEARLWAAIRLAGDGAMLSHQTAAEVHGIIDKPLGTTIHITVARHRRPAQRRPTRGIVIHRSDQSQPEFVGPFMLPRTRIEDTVLDLVAAASTFDRAYTWIARAVSRKLVTVSGLRAALAVRHRVRWRDWLNEALEDACDGVHSSLERRYVRDVERAHGLPKSQHQARRQFDGKAHYRDNWYDAYRVVVEIDGPSYHQNEQVQQDKNRDNLNLALDDVKTHRFGPVAVTERACETAAMVTATLQRGGWQGSPRPCRRPNCTITRPRRT
jgi:very-short-patch-repair endonuclease